jgi:chromosome segregation ATPase
MSNATQKAGKQGGTFADRLKYLENATQSVLQLSKELKDSEAYQSDIRRLKDEIVNKDALITKKDAETTKKAIANGELIEQFRSKAVQWAEEKSTLQKSLEDEKAKQALANARKLDAATKEATAAQQRAHRDREELREVKAQLSGFKTQLEDTETELQTLQSSIGLVGSTERLLVAGLWYGTKANATAVIKKSIFWQVDCILLQANMEEWYLATLVTTYG